MSLDIVTLIQEIDVDDIDHDVLIEKLISKKQSIEKRRKIREAIELRQMARELDLNNDDFKDTLHW